MELGQLLRCKGWPEIVPVRLPQNHQRLLLSFRRQLAIGGSSPQPMHHHGVSLRLHPPQKLAYPPFAYSHPFRCFPLCHLSVSGSLQPVQPVPFLLAHRDSFHPSASRLSIGTFYLALLGTFHLAATRRHFLPVSHLARLIS